MAAMAAPSASGCNGAGCPASRVIAARVADAPARPTRRSRRCRVGPHRISVGSRHRHCRGGSSGAAWLDVRATLITDGLRALRVAASRCCSAPGHGFSTSSVNYGSVPNDADSLLAGRVRSWAALGRGIGRFKAQPRSWRTPSSSMASRTTWRSALALAIRSCMTTAPPRRRSSR